MSRAIFFLLAGLLASIACVKVTMPDVVITAEPQAEELRGARWQDLPVEYCIVENGRGFASADEFRTLTARAFETWGIASVDRGICGGEITRANGINEIGWGQLQDQQGGDEEAGFTRIVFRQCSKGCENGSQSRIVEADVIISDDPPPRWRNSGCLYSTLLHEIGHFLGLPHLDSPAIMAPASATCPQELTQMDRDALSRLYGGAY